MSRTAHRGGLFLLIALALVAGCARSPDAKKARYLERGDRYFRQAQYPEAILEYRNALRIEGTNAHATRQLGLAYYQTGELQQAFTYLLKAQTLEPNNLDVRLKLGTIYLLGGRTEEAASEAEVMLQKDPKNLPALALLAGAARTPQQVDTAIQRLEAVRADAETHATFHLALAGLYLRKPDAVATERAFQEAVARDPTSIEAHTGLGNFYLSRRDAAHAEREFKAAAELAPPGSPARVKLAEFYLLLDRRDEAKAILKEITEKAPAYLPAWRLLAQISLVEGKLDDTVQAIDEVLKKKPEDPEAHGLRGRVHLAKAETPQAIQEFQTALKAEPRLAPIRYQLAVAQLQAGNVELAKTELMTAIAAAPDFADANLRLAQLNIQMGAVQLAVADLETFIARQPHVLDAYGLLSSAYLAQRDAVGATAVGHKLATVAPMDPRGPYLVGLGLLGQGQRAAARQELERSLTLGPGFLDPLAQLVRLDVAEQHPEAALNRVKKQIALVPTSGVHRVLLGDTYAARRQTTLAEAAYLEAIAREPRRIDAYLRLSSLYAASGQYEQALTKAQEAVTVDPRNTGALMLVGVIHETKGDIPQARVAYEKALAVNPRLVPAANNLAWLYSEHGGDQAKALELAQTAKALAPDDPRISDTLGWILYKRGQYQHALALLRESAAHLPDNPQVQYHLGKAYAQVGDKDGAGKALTLAVNSPQNFQGKADARKALGDVTQERSALLVRELRDPKPDSILTAGTPGPLKRPIRLPGQSPRESEQVSPVAILLVVIVVPFLLCSGILLLVSSRRRGRKLARILVALVSGSACGALWILLVDTVVNAPMPGATNEPAVLVVGVVTAALIAACLLLRPDQLRQMVGRSAMVVGFHSLALPIAALISFAVRGAQWFPAASVRPALTAVILGTRLAGDLSTVGLSVGGLLFGICLVFVGDRILTRSKMSRPRARFDLSRPHA